MSNYQKWQVLKICTICKDDKTFDRGPWRAESKKTSSFQWHVNQMHPEKIANWKDIMTEIRRPTPRWQREIDEEARNGTKVDSESSSNDQNSYLAVSETKDTRALRKRKVRTDEDHGPEIVIKRQKTGEQSILDKATTKKTCAKRSTSKRKREESDKENDTEPKTKKRKSMKAVEIRKPLPVSSTEDINDATEHDMSDNETLTTTDHGSSKTFSIDDVQFVKVTKRANVNAEVDQDKHKPGKMPVSRTKKSAPPIADSQPNIRIVQPAFEEHVLIADRDDLAALLGNLGSELQLLAKFAFGDYGESRLVLDIIAPQEMVEPRVIPYLIAKARYFAGLGPIDTVSELEAPHKLTELFLRASSQINQYTLEEDQFDRAIVRGDLGTKAKMLTLAAFPDNKQDVALWEDDPEETKEMVKNVARYLLAKVRYFRSPELAVDVVSNVDRGDGRWNVVPGVPLSYMLA